MRIHYLWYLCLFHLMSMLVYVSAEQLVNSDHMESRWVSERLTESLQDVRSQRGIYGVPELQKGCCKDLVCE